MSEEIPGTALAVSDSGTVVHQGFSHGLQPSDVAEAYKLAGAIAKTGMCGVQSPEDALARMMFGRELGLTAMQSIRGVYMVEGRPGLDASFMHALCLRSGDCEKFDCTEESNESVTYTVKRRGHEAQVITWTLDMAKQAKLTDRGKDPSNNNWNKYPKQMLHARCKSEAARRVWPDRLAGFMSSQELNDGVIDTVPVLGDANEFAVVQNSAADVEKTAKELLALVANATSREAMKDVRAAIKSAAEAGRVVDPWTEQVTRAYTEKVRSFTVESQVG